MAGYLLTDAAGAVDRALRGWVRASGGRLALSEDPTYVVATQPNPSRRVALVAGGGSGHEPMHVGLVGAGLLDAAIPGAVFTSPHNRQIYEGSRAVARAGGVLHIVKNYTGDTINFGIAAERLRQDGIPVGTVVVDDDIATDDPNIHMGRRGTGATVVIEKILGAAADRGYDLESLVALGTRSVAASRSIALASAPHTTLGTGEPAFELPAGTVEYGVGIHGERSGRTVGDTPLSELVDRMAGELSDALRGLGSRALLFVNGLGSTTGIELCALLEEATTCLENRAWTVDRFLVGSIVTALDMRGFSLTLTVLDDELVDLWDDASADRRWI